MLGLRRIGVVVLGALLVPHVALAQAPAAVPGADWPARPVRIVVPRATGGLVDVMARAYAQLLAERLGQPVIVENRPGAGGLIAGEAVARAAPDGYTLFAATQDSQVLTPLLRKKPPYDPLRDFTPVSLLFTTPLFVFAHPGVPAKSMEELVALARARPGKLTYASLGVGSVQHLAAELFKSRTKLDIVHIPYKSTSQAMVEQMTGQVDLNFTAGTTLFPQVQAGKLRVLGTTGARRSTLHPDVPTLAEAGITGVDMEPWYGIAAPAGLPARIVERLNRETVAILTGAGLRERFVADGLEPRAGPPAEFEARIKSDVPLWTQILKDAGVPQE
jgi:tripartite-type tricarboxylate transporter receptor subunit TctC